MLVYTVCLVMQLAYQAVKTRFVLRDCNPSILGSVFAESRIQSGL